MNFETMRIGVVGTGAAARAHLVAVRTLETARVAGIAGREVATAKALSDSFGISSYSDAEALFRAREIDAVILAVPPYELADLAISAFAWGKHVLCEKPLGVDASQAERVVTAWKRSERVGMINFCYRLIPEFREFKARLQSGACGRLNLIKAEWVLPKRLDPALTYHWKGQRELGGGVLQNYGVHVLDYLFSDHDEIRLLDAHQATRQAVRPDARGEFRTITGDEVTTALFLRSGVPVFVHLSLVTTPGFGLRIIAEGTQGSLELSNGNMAFPAGPFRLNLHGVSEPLTPPSGSGFGLDRIFAPAIREFVETIKGRGAGQPSLECGLKVARIVEEMQTKAVSGNPA